MVKTLVEVIWMDAVSGVEEGEIKSPKEYLVASRTYGKILSEDDKAIFICHNENDSQIEYTVIPRAWIKKIKYLDNLSEL